MFIKLHNKHTLTGTTRLNKGWTRQALSGPAMDGNEKDDIDIMETQQAVDNILNTDHNYTQNTDLKRKHSETDENQDPQNTQQSPENKKQHIIRYYKPENNGPYEIIVQNKNKRKINPFEVGKIIKTNYNDILHITRTGKNLTVTCSTYESANKLVDSQHLNMYNVFVPSNKIYSTGVINIESDIPENEILENIESEYDIIQAQRIKRINNNILTNTHFVKLIFDSDNLPKYVYMNYVRMEVNVYIMPVKQCFRCFSYGHVAGSPCNRNRICRDCGLEFHSGECQAPLKCIHCFAQHSSNSKKCPEYIRQKNIKNRMSVCKEDFYKASQYFPITYKKINKNKTHINYSAASQYSPNDADYPDLPHIHNQRANIEKDLPINVNNRFTHLQNEAIDTSYTNYMPYNTKPVIHNRYANKTTHKPATHKTNTNSTQIKTNLELQNTNTNEKLMTHEIEEIKSKIRSKIDELKKKSNTTTPSKKLIDDIFSTILSTFNENPINVKHSNNKTSERNTRANINNRGVTGVSNVGSPNKFKPNKT